MTPAIGGARRRRSMSPEDAVHWAVFGTIAVSLAMYAAAGDDFGAGRVMAVVLGGLVVSSCIAWLGQLWRGFAP